MNAVLEPSVFDLIRKTLDSLVPVSLDPGILNREAGFGVGSLFSFEHSDPDGLNAGLHHLLMLSWRSQRRGKVFGEAVALHPAVTGAVKLLSEAQWQGSLGALARACGASEAHLSRTFHRQVGVSLSRYRNTLRLSHFWERYRDLLHRATNARIEDALQLGTIGFDAVKHLLLCRVKRRPPRLDMQNYPHLPMAEVRTTQASDYMSLLEGAVA